MNGSTGAVVECRRGAGVAVDRMSGRNLDVSGPGAEAGGSLEGRVELLGLTLPEDYRPYTDKYFLRAGEILKAENLNPWIRAQVFIRKGPGTVRGIEEALSVIEKYSDLRRNGGRIYAVEEGSEYESKDTLMVLEGRVQDIVEFETMYLGVLVAATTRANHDVMHVDPDVVTENVRKVKALIGDRPLTYMGARHWTFREDAVIGRAAFEGGAEKASTDIAAGTFGQKGVGTIPHALENIYAWKYGRELAVAASTAAFDRVIDPEVPRIALIDYDNTEIDDSLRTARLLHHRVKGGLTVRVDTCGENVAQGAFETFEDVPEGHPFRSLKDEIPEEDLKYWFGRGVTVSGVFAIREALDAEGFHGVKILLSSGFGSVEKAGAFVRAEEILGIRLFDSVGAGGFFGIPCREATMDIVAVADTLDGLDESPVSKVGRVFRPNSNLRRVLM